MANKPNQLGSGGVVNRLQELERRFKDRMQNPSAPEASIIERIGALEEYKIGRPNQSGSSAEIAQDVANAMTQIEKLYAQMAPIEARREQSATRSYVGAATTTLRSSNILSEVNAMASQTGAMFGASTMTGTPTHILERMRSEAIAGVRATSNTISERIRNDPNQPLNQGLIGSLSSGMSTAAQAQAALILQRQMGLDVKSRMLESGATANRISDYLESRDLAQNVRQGKMGTRADVESGLRGNLADIERFQNAQGKYANDPEKFERFQKAIDKLTDSASKAANTLKEMDRQGVGGGWYNNSKIMGGLQLVQAGAGLGRDLMDTWTYSNPLRERQNQAGYANLANRQFDDARAALSGDMSALRRLGGAYGAASEANKSAKAGSKVSSAFDAVGGLAGIGLSTGAGLAAAALAGTGVGIPIALGVLGAAAIANKVAGNWNQQAGERGQALANAEIARQDALSHINDASVQAYRDYATSVGRATIGMGGSRAGTFDVMNSSDAVRRNAEVGIDPARAAQLASMGVQVMGGEFNAGQIRRAGQLRQGGYMNEEQYFQNLGQLSSVGGNADKNLEEILKNAVANGMDSAKSIGQMVQATSQLASRTVGAGVDTVAGSSAMISRMMDSMSDANIPMNMRGAAAQNTANYLEGASGDRGLNLRTVGRWSATGKAFPNASMAQMQRLSSLTLSEISQLSDPNSGAAFAKQIGLGSQLLDPSGAVDKNKIKSLQDMTRLQMANALVGPGVDEATRIAIATGKPLTTQQEESARALASDRGINFESFMGGIGTGRGRSGTVRTTTEGGAGEIDAQQRAKAEGDAKLIEQGRDIIDALGGLKGLTEALNSVAKNFDPKEMNKASQQAAKDFSIPVHEFGDAVKSFSVAVSGMNFTKR